MLAKLRLRMLRLPKLSTTNRSGVGIFSNWSRKMSISRFADFHISGHKNLDSLHISDYFAEKVARTSQGNAVLSIMTH